MDQLKDFLKQCVKYRFWIAVGISVLLPIIGYFVGSGPMVEATKKRETDIKGAKAEVGKYTAPGIVNGDYQPIQAQKKEILTKDVEASWRKLHATQEPLLKWPEEVEPRFRAWGRGYPPNVDKTVVTNTLIDYATFYPAFLSKVYTRCKPFNFEDGSGIVVAPDEKALLKAPTFSPDSPPDLGRVWAEQERIWVVTALLDAIAKINDSVGAKDWDGAAVKQINLIDVGSQMDQDQVSVVNAVALVPADAMPDPTAPAGSAPASTPSTPGTPGGGAAAVADEVYYLKTDAKQFKTLPIKMVVLVDQNKLADFLVGLENSPMSISIKEAEITKPASPVVKPAYGEKSAFSHLNQNSGPGMGRGVGDMTMNPGGGGSASQRALRGGMDGGSGPGAMPGNLGGMGGRNGAAAEAKKGVDNRNANTKADRLKKEQQKKARAETKTKVDQYFNVIEVTVYGQARFYLQPPPAPAESTSPGAVAPSTPPAPKAEAPKPTETPKAEEPPKKDEAVKAEAAVPKKEEPKPDESKPKGDSPKTDPAKGDSSPGKP